MDLERAASMIKALPYMSKTIVDDTLYEKVLSFLTLVLSTDPSHVTKLDEQCHMFQHIEKACIGMDDQDYRVITLSIRLMGQIVHHGKDDFFRMLERDHHDLLILMTKGITSSEAALRCACIEACRSFLVCDQGQIWLLQNEEVTSFIMLALLDQSSYVVAEACRLFANLIEFNLTTLMDVMDPSNLIRHLLQPGTADSKQTVAALDFCWTLVNIKNDNVIDYIRTKQLLHSFISLLCLSDRIVRARVVEILSILFIWDKDPLQTLNLETCHSDTNKAYMVMLKTVKGMIKEAKKLDDLMTAISLLDASFALLTQINQTDINPLSDMAYHVLYALISLCVNHEEGGEQDEFRQVKKFIDTNRTKANLLQLLLRTINTLVRLDTRLIQESNFSDIVFNVLENKMLYSDSRVLKSALILLTSTLWHANRVEHILSKTIESLVKMSDDIGLDCKSLIMVLDTLNTLLGHDQIGLLVTESGHRLAESLSLKFLDTEWDVRDASVHFVGQLFEAPFVKTKIQFALAFNLPLDVFERIHDSEAYVRASAVEVLQMMMASKEGWDYVQQHKVSRELAAKLPSLLHDTEAFVRRAALDAIICLVKNRFCQGMLMEIKDQPNSLNPSIIRKLIYDDDVDVRSRACKLIGHLWLLYRHEKQQHKKGQQREEGSFFHLLQAGELLIESAMDTNRIVRIEAVRVIESILAVNTSASQDDNNDSKKKRPFEQVEQEEDSHFLNVLRRVNLTQQKQTLDPEHLYQEAFDINADMMTQSIIPTNPDDDINMLDCY